MKYHNEIYNLWKVVMQQLQTARDINDILNDISYEWLSKQEAINLSWICWSMKAIIHNLQSNTDNIDKILAEFTKNL